MLFDKTDLAKGVEDGLGLCMRSIHGVRLSDDALKKAHDLISRAFEKEPTQWHPRAITLFSQLITIGAICRAHYGEPALTSEQVAIYLKHVGALFNSFTHK